MTAIRPLHRDGNNGKFTKPPVIPDLQTEQTGEQHPGNYSEYGASGSGAPMLYGFLWGNGGTWDNPLGFPGYGQLYTGRYDTYRWQLQHPTLRLVRSIAVSTILASKWEYEAVNGGTDEEVKFIQGMFDQIRDNLMNDFFIRGRDYGWASGEVLWELRGTETHIARIKPLLNDVTRCLRDEHGSFSGVENDVSIGDNQQVRLSAPFKAWKYTYDSEAGYLYGRSWLENVRSTAWRDWLDCAQQLQKLGAKITGIQLIVTAPAGTYPGPKDGNGNPTTVSWRDTSKELIKALANGAPGAYLPSLALPVDVKGNINTAKIIAELAKSSQINCTLLNHGTNTPAIAGLLERMKHNEELMFMGGLQPSRTGLEAQHGAKADADTHTDTATRNSELDDRDFACQCQPLVDSALIVNKGMSRKGKVRIKPPSLVDRKTGYLRALMLAAMNDPAIASVMMETIDVDHELDFIGIKRKTDFDPAKVKAAMEERNKQTTNKKPEPQGGRPTPP